MLGRVVSLINVDRRMILTVESVSVRLDRMIENLYYVLYCFREGILFFLIRSKRIFEHILFLV